MVKVKKKRYFVSALFCLLLSIFITTATTVLPNKLEDIVEAVNQTLPKRYLGTRLERLELTADIVEFHITITDIQGLKEEQYAWYSQASKTSDWMRSCVDPFYLQFLNNNVSIKRIRSSEVSTLSFVTNIHPKDCDYFKFENTERLITKYIKEQNVFLPVMVDNATMLIGYKQMYSDTIEVTYKIVNTEAKNADKKLFRKLQTEKFMPFFCNSSDFSILMKRDVSFVIRYVDLKNLPFFKFRFNRKVCSTYIRS